MIVTDLPTLLPSVYGASNALRSEVLKAIRYARIHPAAKDDIVALFEGAAVLAENIPAPGVTSAPSITGTAAVGSTLTVVPGVYTNSTSVARAWLADGVVIAGATGTTLALTSDHLDASITVRETATGPGGSTVSTSAAVGPVIDPEA